MDHKQFFAELYAPPPRGDGAAAAVTQLDAADADAAVRQANAWAFEQGPALDEPMLIRVIVDGQVIYDGPFGDIGEDEAVIPAA